MALSILIQQTAAVILCEIGIKLTDDELQTDPGAVLPRPSALINNKSNRAAVCGAQTCFVFLVFSTSVQVLTGV